MFPDVRIARITTELPQAPEEHPDFWPLWKAAIRDAVQGRSIDYVFASEPYGFRLADELAARYIPVDHARELISTSGTRIRDNPLANWDHLPEVVRPYYLKRVCVFGPESTGKSTLAAQLAGHFNTRHVFEYARPLIDLVGNTITEDLLLRIARGQAAAQLAMANQANRVLICDTDPLLTTVWSNALLGYCPQSIQELAAAHPADLYLLTDIDVPWVNDGQRYFPNHDDRIRFLELCRDALQTQPHPFVVISGHWNQRLNTAINATQHLLAPPHG